MPKSSSDAARRQKRLDRWRRPLEGRRDRAAAWTNMLLVDHGFLRLAYLNLHRVSALAWRSGQPAPYQIASLARRGVRTVISLRGGQSFGSLPLEREACARNGIAFRNLVLRSRSLPPREELLAIDAAFAEIETPVLFHCKAGADRAGFAAGLWLILREGAEVEAALAQLSWRYGHVSSSRTGVLDAFFQSYAAAERKTGIGLRDWIGTEYDPAAITANFRSTGLGRLLGDRLLIRE